MLCRGVAQVSNLLYRRFPLGARGEFRRRLKYRDARRLEALRYSRLETCATPLVDARLSKHCDFLSDFRPQDPRGVGFVAKFSIGFVQTYHCARAGRKSAIGIQGDPLCG